MPLAPFRIPCRGSTAVRTPTKEATGLPFSPTDPQELRDNLHIWVLENVGHLNRHYRQSYARPLSPQEALTAPLTALAELLGHSRACPTSFRLLWRFRKLRFPKPYRRLS